MSNAPRLEIDLDKIYHNALTLVDRLGRRGISVTAVTKATLGSPEIARVLLKAGVSGLGDSRIENIQAMRAAGVSAQMMLIRTPMLSQAALVVAYADVSLNTEIDVIAKLSAAAQAAKKTHEIVLMVELGDLREGVMPEDLESTVREVLRLPNITLKGIGANLACHSGVAPDARNMDELSLLSRSIDAIFGPMLSIVSGGNSSNIPWALSDANTGRINNLRIGEAILLGREPLHRQPIDGLHTDAFTVIGEVIEAKVKPSLPWGTIAETAFGEKAPVKDRGPVQQTILAIGHMDTDPNGLTSPAGINVLGASSDHLVLETGSNHLPVGTEIKFQPNYSAMLRAMASPFVTKVLKGQSVQTRTRSMDPVQ